MSPCRVPRQCLEMTSSPARLRGELAPYWSTYMWLSLLLCCLLALLLCNAADG